MTRSARPFPRQPEYVPDMQQERPPDSALGRAELLALARRLGWPKCTYGLVTLEGEQRWTAAAMPYRSDRRELFAQLQAIQQSASARRPATAPKGEFS